MLESINDMIALSVGFGITAIFSITAYGILNKYNKTYIINEMS